MRKILKHGPPEPVDALRNSEIPVKTACSKTAVADWNRPDNAGFLRNRVLYWFIDGLCLVTARRKTTYEKRNTGKYRARPA